VNALVVGFAVEETRRLSTELRAAGHHVLGAVGKQGAWTFLRAIAPDAVIVPAGAEGERARSWVLELGVEVPFVEVQAGPDSLAKLLRQLRGEPTEPIAAPAMAAAIDAGEAPEEVSAELVIAPREPREAPEATPPTSAAAPAEPGPGTKKRRRPARDEADEDAEPREPHPDLVSKLAQVRFGDYHSILEVEPQASPYAVREQFDRLARRFSPRGWPGRLAPEDIEMLDEIGRGLADAFLILSDPELATRYERALSGARTLSPASTESLPRPRPPSP
jgi:hypothetical protein